jgi:hypothetical protein
MQLLKESFDLCDKALSILFYYNRLGKLGKLICKWNK